MLRALPKILGAMVAVVISLIILYGIFAESAALQSYGLPGIFLSALLSHLSIIARDMFLPALLSLTEFYSPALLGLVAGLGGALGEATAYYWGSGIRDALDNSRKKESPSSKMVEKYGLTLMLLFASTPLPDTSIVLLAGSLRLSLWKVIGIQLLGKVTLYLVGAYVGGLIFMELKSSLDYEAASIISLVVSLILCILVSWRKSRERILKIANKIIITCFSSHKK
ncbi:MAG: VTT domain-containing protein [Candidatus Bathyarchaeia archaeon]